ncbi:hypothetical protein [Deinococcus seoulensis]|uniref:hypothetical protein n=1 Tax=Deinococcus seoulensis TaxID=1837379 RepID=UPI001665F39F|nr:hypothetical protein [Deinococcus seoulensis]
MITGSSRSEVGRYKLQGLRYRRLTEVEARTLLPEADLGAQVRQLFTALIASGQLGGTLQAPTQESIPDLNVTSAAIHGNYWPVAKLLDERLRGRSRQTRTYLNADGSTQSRDVNPEWGVNADLRPVFGYPAGTLVIDEAALGVEIDGMDTDSTTLVTDVRVMFTRTMPPGQVISRTFQDGDGRDAVAHPEDVRAPVALTREFNVAPRTFGQAWRSLALPVTPELFTGLPGSTVTVSVRSFVAQEEATIGTLTVTGDDAALWDGQPGTAVSITAPSGVVAVEYALEVAYPAGMALPDGFMAQMENGGLGGVTLVGQNLTVTPTQHVFVDVAPPLTPTPPVYLLPGVTRDVRLAPAWASGGRLVLRINHTDLSQPLVIRSACLIRASPELMAASTTPLARTPTLNPVTARLPGWNHSPAATAQLTLRGPLGEVVETRELPIELLVYDTDDDGELFTEVRCGQRDEAEALSFTAVISARDQNATTDAVQAST